MSEVPTPIGTPPRGELWRRIRVAESILAHRPIVPESTRQELLKVLRGESVSAADPKEAG